MVSMDVVLKQQLQRVFEALEEELSNSSSGVVIVQLRNNAVGKFGIRHDPIQKQEGVKLTKSNGLTEEQRLEFKDWILNSLSLKKGWTHGEMQFEFTLASNELRCSTQFESNYNMAALTS
jgi:hypothetical protein